MNAFWSLFALAAVAGLYAATYGLLRNSLTVHTSVFGRIERTVGSVGRWLPRRRSVLLWSFLTFVATTLCWTAIAVLVAVVFGSAVIGLCADALTQERQIKVVLQQTSLARDELSRALLIGRVVAALLSATTIIAALLVVLFGFMRLS